MKFFLVISCFICFLSYSGFSQSDSLQKAIWKAYRKYNTHPERIVQNNKIEPKEIFSYTHADKKLSFIMLIYGHTGFRQYYIIKDHLVRIITRNSWIIKQKRRYNNYYFQNDSLLEQRITYKDTLSVDDLLKIYKVYKAKGDTL